MKSLVRLKHGNKRPRVGGVVPLRPPVTQTTHQLDCSSSAFAATLSFRISARSGCRARPLQQSTRSGDQRAKMFRRVRCDRSRTCCQRSTSGPLKKSDLTDISKRAFDDAAFDRETCAKRSGDQPAKMFRRVRCDRSRTCCQRSTSAAAGL